MSEVLAVTELITNPIIVGLIVGLPGTIALYRGLRHAEKKDRDAATAAVVSASGTAVQQVIDGLNTIVDNLQDDNKVLRKSVDALSKRLGSVIEENHALKDRVAELKENYGE